MRKKRIRVAVIGLGKMGLLHASLVNVIPETELVVLCDKSKLLNRIYRRAFSPTSVKVVNDLKKLSNLDLDAAYITTPISSHSFLIKSLYENRITRNIFVEKTLASNSVEARELCEIAKKTSSITMVGYMKRFNVVFNKAKDLLTHGTLGEPQSFKAYAYSSDFMGQTKNSMSSASRGGALKDIGCHIIDLALWLFGDFKIVDTISSFEIGGSQISTSFTVASSNGLSGRFDISQRMPNYRMPEFGFSIECSKGELDVNDDRLRLFFRDGAQSIWYRHDLQDNVKFSLGETEYYRENREFINSLIENRTCEPNFDTALKVDYIIDGVRKEAV